MAGSFRPRHRAIEQEERRGGTLVVAEHPIPNSPFEEPRRHFRFSDEGITDQVIEERRVSSYCVPVAKPKKKGAQLSWDSRSSTQI